MKESNFKNNGEQNIHSKMRQQHLAPLRVSSFRKKLLQTEALKESKIHEVSVMSLKAPLAGILNPGLRAFFQGLGQACVVVPVVTLTELTFPSASG